MEKLSNAKIPHNLYFFWLDGDSKYLHGYCNNHKEAMKNMYSIEEIEVTENELEVLKILIA